MSIKEVVQNAVKQAMVARDKERLETIRMITAAFKQVEVDERIELDDTRVLSILDKMLKQRRESIRQFEAGGRLDLSAVVKKEMVIIQEFMPASVTEEELEAIIIAAIKETSAATVRDMSKVMAILKPQLQGKADFAVVGAKIKALLSE